MAKKDNNFKRRQDEMKGQPKVKKVKVVEQTSSVGVSSSQGTDAPAAPSSIQVEVAKPKTTQVSRLALVTRLTTK